MQSTSKDRGERTMDQTWESQVTIIVMATLGFFQGSQCSTKQNVFQAEVMYTVAESYRYR